MQIKVHHYNGDQLPEAFRQLAVPEIWLVANGDHWVAVFFTQEDANSYAAWYQCRLDHEMTLELESEPEDDPTPEHQSPEPPNPGKGSKLKFR